MISLKRLNSERGAALILVLFGITLAMLFIMFQMAQLISTKTQVTSAEKNIDSNNITKMAVHRYKKEINHVLGAGNTDFGVEIVPEIKRDSKNIKKKIDDKVDKNIKEKLDDNHMYQIKTDGYDKNKGILTFTVVGEAYEKETEWKGEIKIK